MVELAIFTAAENSLLYPSSSIWLPNALPIADAAATALFVAGDDWPTIAAAMNIDRVMLVRPDGQIELSPLMEDRVRLIGNTKPAIIRTETLSAKDENQP